MFWLSASWFLLFMQLLISHVNPDMKTSSCISSGGKNHQKYYLKAKIHGDGCTTNHVLFSRVCWVTLWSGPLSWPPSTHHHILPASLSLRSSILSLPLALFLSEQWEIPSPVSVRPVNSCSLKFGGPVAIQPLEYHCTSKLLLRVFP